MNMQIGGSQGPAPIQPGGETAKSEGKEGLAPASHLNPTYGVEGSTSDSPESRTPAEKLLAANVLQSVTRGALSDE